MHNVGLDRTRYLTHDPF